MSLTNDNQPPSPNQATSPAVDSHVNPPAFLDLADSAARLNSNLPDINARIEQKRLEHERQRALQRKHFEDQMRALEQQQLQEERALLVAPSSLDDLLTKEQHVALSAPTTPPRTPALTIGESMGSSAGVSALHHQALTNGLSDYPRKSVNYAAVPPRTGTPSAVSNSQHGYAAGAKSMPGSRRGSSGSRDEHDDLTASLHSLTIKELDAKAVNDLNRGGLRSATTFGSGYNSTYLFDDDLDNEMTNSLRQLPTQTEDERFNVRAHYSRKLSVSGAALDLAPLAQTQSRSFANRTHDNGVLKTSEWPQFSGPPRASDMGGLRLAPRATSHNIGAIGGDLSVSTTAASLAPASPEEHRKPSPPAFGSSDGSTLASTRSVPATPLSSISNSALRAELGMGVKTPGVPISPIQPGNDAGDAGSRTQFTPDLATSNAFQRHQYDNITFGSIRPDESIQSHYGNDLYGMPNGGPDAHRGYGGNNYSAGYSGPRGIGGAGYGDMNGYNGAGGRYGLPLGGGRFGPDKMNGLGGPKHKRSDIDREFNRFAGTRLEDLQGDIPSLCKDQHGCRYLQKKLEEGVPEHRDMIFRETFGHFADLMTDPFGNYLCQKLLEYSTDEQRNVICESVAQDLVQISLNMHGTRAVQKMIDFLSTQRQTDTRYDAQIHSIIVALSLHVVTLIKDLNGNHVVQKCLNRLAPEDNQFIYNAVAAHCVEVATHRHGCCVLQRCIDHASDSQRVQLVTEITYNALTLVQDPYGNYVVQYILDLNDNRFSDAVIRQFLGNVCALSVQKFSSNVIEKCIRVAEHSTRKMLIEELLNRTRLEKLLRDSFGNYCVQTALDYAEPGQRMILVEGIRPILPLIRNTPYGKRIQSKLQREQAEAGHGGHYGGGFNGNHHHVGHSGFSNGMHGGRHHMSQQSMHHASQLGDPYAQHSRSSVYSMGPNGAQHGMQSQLHPSQVHPVLDHSPYSSQQHLGLGPQSANLGSMNGSPFASSVYSNPLPASYAGNGVSTGLNDHYARSNYSYAM